MTDLSVFETALRQRSSNTCELCGAADDLTVIGVPPEDTTAERAILVCLVCTNQVKGGDLDEKHWFCLKESAWSEVAAVQVVALRLLKDLGSAPWAQDLLGQMYLAEDVQAWADAGNHGANDDDAIVTLDSNGTRLEDGDSVTLIKDLVVKGAGFTAKRGTMVRGIRLIGDPENIEGKVNKTMLVLKTKFLKKA